MEGEATDGRTRAPGPVDEIGLGDVIALRDGVTLVAIAHEAVLYDESAGRIHELNTSAAALCACIDGTSSLDAHAQRLVGVFDADVAEVRADVRTAARTLAQLGALTVVDPFADRATGSTLEQLDGPAGRDFAPDAHAP